MGVRNSGGEESSSLEQKEQPVSTKNENSSNQKIEKNSTPSLDETIYMSDNIPSLSSSSLSPSSNDEIVSSESEETLQKEKQVNNEVLNLFREYQKVRRRKKGGVDIKRKSESEEDDIEERIIPPTRVIIRKKGNIEDMKENEAAFQRNLEKQTSPTKDKTKNLRDNQIYKKSRPVDKMPPISEEIGEEEEETFIKSQELEKTSERTKPHTDGIGAISQNLENDEKNNLTTPFDRNSPERQPYKKPRPVNTSTPTSGGNEEDTLRSFIGRKASATTFTTMPDEMYHERAAVTTADTKFYNEFFELQNKFRKKHGVPELILSKVLMKFAERRAQYFADHDIRKITDLHKYGESVHILRGTMTYSGEQIARYWYAQISNYDFEADEPGDNSEAFTQMVWKSTREFGIAIKRSGKLSWIVAIYNPPGNFARQYSDNVNLPLGRDSSEVYQRSTEKATFERECLEAHNKYRQLHGCSPLKLNRKLCDAATDWVQIIAKIKKLRLEDGIRYGVNMIKAESAFSLSGEQVVHLWYKECENYDYSAGKFSKATRHFTQLIWKNTTDLGVGYCRDGYFTFVVCYYDPAGNTAGEFLKNVDVNVNHAPQSIVPASANDEVTFENQLLIAHNKYRALHGCPPLILSSELSAVATNWSYALFQNTTNMFTFVRTTFMEHRPTSMYGENTFFAQNVPNLTGEHVVKVWYDEVSQFKFDDPKFSVSTAHFTQVVWATTRYLGVGVTKKNNSTWVVCNYDPPGNIADEYHLNIPRVGSPPFVYVDSDRAFIEQCLSAHNKYRSMHGCPPLELSHRLCHFASEWAHFLARLKIVQRRPSNVLGENIGMCRGKVLLTGERMVKAWYQGITKYDFNDPSFSDETKYFTQVIWKNSTELGVSRVQNGDITIVVAYYSPCGNVSGEFEENVPRPQTY